MRPLKINKLSPRVKAYVMLIVVAAIWGIASPVIKYTLNQFDPLTFLTYRFGISTILAIVIFSIFGFNVPKNKKTFWTMLLYGFITSTVSLGLLFLGLNNTTVLNSSLITLISPLVISMAGVVFLKETITKREKLGMGIAVFGTFLTLIGPILQNFGGSSGITGNLLVLGYVLSASVGVIIGKKLLRAGVKPITLANFSFIVGFLTLLPFAIFSGFSLKAIYDIPYTYHLGVFYMAILSGSFAYYLSNRAQKSIEVSEASVFSYLHPLFAAPLAVLWLGEKITPVFIIGAIIIAIGVTIAEMKKKR